MRHRAARLARRMGGCAIVLGMLVAGHPLRAAELLDRVLAVVSGTVITLSDARAAISLGLVDPGAAVDPVSAALRWLVDRQLVLDEINRYDAGDADSAGIAARLGAIRKRFTSDEEYAATLRRLGLDGAGVRVLVRDTLRVEAHVASRFDTLFVATENELREYVAQHPEQFVRDGRPADFDAVQ
ncbi:MAG: hypothetical protein NTY02_17100, partial [Acidobacteria bacterium]|nr:hypothetical protein [Acidobacteriota bacterium]